MSRLFETVEDYIKYVENATVDFAETEMHDFLIANMSLSALDNVYALYRPKRYIRQYTLTDWQYYKTDIESKNFETTGLDSYTYSTSPHVNSVVDGAPYDFDFEYNGKPRPYIAQAEKSLRSGKKISELKAKLVRFYNDYGLIAK